MNENLSLKSEISDEIRLLRETVLLLTQTLNTSLSNDRSPDLFEEISQKSEKSVGGRISLKTKDDALDGVISDEKSEEITEISQTLEDENESHSFLTLPEGKAGELVLDLLQYPEFMERVYSDESIRGLHSDWKSLGGLSVGLTMFTSVVKDFRNGKYDDIRGE